MKPTILLLSIMLQLWAARGASVHAQEAPVNSPPTDQQPFTVTVTGSGPPMILIPGLACGGDVWDGTVAHFKDTYQCHVVTLAGFAGQPALDLSVPLLPRVHDGLVRYIRDHKLGKPIIMGHSLGAFLAFWLGADAPEHTGPIIAVDGVPFYPALRDPGTSADAQRPMAEYLRNTLKNQPPPQFAAYNRMTLTGMITLPENVDKVASSSNRSDPASVAQALHELLTQDLREKGKAIRSPYLLLAAATQGTSPQERKRAEELYLAQVAQVPNHKVVFAPKARHFIQLDEPGFLFEQVESFLRAVKKDGAP